MQGSGNMTAVDGIVPAVQVLPTVPLPARAAHTLMPYLIEPAHLHRAARACMRRCSAPGIDGVTWAQYRRGLRERLAELAARLRDGTWRPTPLREVTIDAFTGRQFVAGVPTAEDRIVHRAIRAAADPILEHMAYEPWVSGYRPSRNRLTAVRHAAAYLTSHHWIIDVDVRSASAGGTTTQVVNWLATYVHDGTFLARVRTAIDGLPTPLIPGTGLWPMLFNLRLTQVDRQLTDLPVVRFADNYVAFARDETRATAVLARIRSALATVGLTANPTKSRIRQPGSTNPEDLFLIGG